MHDHASALLTAAEDQLAAHASYGELDREYQHLSDRYRAGRATPADISDAGVAAYGLARLPATLAVNVEVLVQLESAKEDWRPRSMADIGAGLGAAAWAAAAAFPTIERVILCEPNPRMLTAGKALAATSELDAIRNATWLPGADVRGVEAADLVVASYVLGEVMLETPAVDAWWRAAADTLVVIEPGTPAAFERVLRARSQLIGLGASIAAPCPHERDCPLASSSWCHFAVRVNRSRGHRAIKNASLGSEDEKYSYVAATRSGRAPGNEARIIRRPTKHGGHVRLELCTDNGLADIVVAKSDGGYKRVRKLRWGDSLRLPTS